MLPCCFHLFGWRRIARARIFSCLDLVLGFASLYLWLPMLFESYQYRGQEWDLRAYSSDTVSSVQWNCGHRFFDLNTPSDVGRALRSPMYLFLASALGNLLSSMLLFYSSLSPDETGHILLLVFLVTQFPLVVATIVGLFWLNSTTALCYYENNLVERDHGRVRFISQLLYVYLLAYKPVELMSTILHLIYLNKKVYPENVHWADLEEEVENAEVVFGAEFAPPVLTEEIMTQALNLYDFYRPILKKSGGAEAARPRPKSRSRFTHSTQVPRTTVADLHTHFPDHIELIE